MALIESLGYKQESPQRRNIRNESLMNDFTMSPYVTHSNNKQYHRSQQFDLNNNNNGHISNNNDQRFGLRSSIFRDNDDDGIGNNNNFLSNNNNINNIPSHSQSISFLNGSSPKQENKMNERNERNENNQNNNKYSRFPKKSMISSGIGFVSPIPPKYNNKKINHKLDISDNNGSINIHNDSSMPISPIKPNINNNNNFIDNTLPLNSTQNTLNLSTTNYHHNESRLMVVDNRENIEYQTQITIIGFPQGEVAFIHRKFRTYGNILNSEWNNNTLFLQYQYSQNAKRALAENGKWIKNDNMRYMIAVQYAEFTEMNPLNNNNNNNINNKYNNNGNGRFLNFSKMYKNSFDNNTNKNVTAYFGQNYNNIEIQQNIQNGPTHILWKIFHFITTGW